MSCMISPTWWRRSASGRVRRSRPSMRTTPRTGSWKRTSSEIRVDLPAPVEPTRATVSPGATLRLMSVSTGSSGV